MKPRISFVAVVLAALCPVPVVGGLYSPDEAPPFEVNEAGQIEPLPLDAFRLLMFKLSELDRPDRPERAELLARVERRTAKGIAALSAEEAAGLTHDLIRLGRADERSLSEAINILFPLTRDRAKVGFIPLAHLARAQHMRRQWDEAYEQQYSALRDYRFPESFPNYTKLHLAWYHRIENDYVLPLLHFRREEGRQKRAGVPDTVDPLFPAPKKGATRGSRQPVQFVGASGRFEPGTIAQAQNEKLPSDAIAIVQQLVLWAPEDSRLLWQLAELYNARGNLEAALQLYDQCVEVPRNYSNPQIMEHRAAVREVLQARNEAERKRREDAEARQRQMYYIVGAVGGGLAVLLGYWQLREWGRRWRGVRRSRSG